MNKLIVALILCFVFDTAIAQTNAPEPQIFRMVEVMPEFPGGEQALSKYLSESIHYPDTAALLGKEAKVRVRFIIDENGVVGNVTTKEKFGYGFNEEAERVVRNMPRWKPGKNNGETVKVYFVIPINFVLAKDDTNKPEGATSPISK